MSNVYKLKKSVSIAAGLFAFLGSVVGVIAAFFPNYLNLSKEEIETFSVVLADDSDVVKLERFLEKNTSKFVNLEISTCIEYPENHCPVISIDNWGVDIYYDQKFCKGDLRNKDSFSIITNNVPMEPSIFMHRDNGRCTFDGEEGDGNLVGSGYFYIPKESPFWVEGFKSWRLKRVSEDSLMMNR